MMNWKVREMTVLFSVKRDLYPPHTPLTKLYPLKIPIWVCAAQEGGGILGLLIKNKVSTFKDVFWNGV